MTQEEKELLLTDICARLPYGVLISLGQYDKNPVKLNSISITSVGTFFNGYFTKGIPFTFNGKGDIRPKPNLRPMSSMTKEEREEIEVFIFNEWYQKNSCKIDKEGWIEILANYDVSGIDPGFCSDYVDWLNAHHFDFRNLIERGLAIEVTEENNPYKK